LCTGTIEDLEETLAYAEKKLKKTVQKQRCMARWWNYGFLSCQSGYGYGYGNLMRVEFAPKLMPRQLDHQK